MDSPPGVLSPGTNTIVYSTEYLNNACPRLRDLASWQPLAAREVRATQDKPFGGGTLHIMHDEITRLTDWPSSSSSSEHFVGRHPDLVGGVRLDEVLDLVVNVLEAVAGHDGGEVLHEVRLEPHAAVVDLLALLVRQPVLVHPPDERHRDGSAKKASSLDSNRIKIYRGAERV